MDDEGKGQRLKSDRLTQCTSINSRLCLATISTSHTLNLSSPLPILVVVDDLLFASKISETARRLGIAVGSATIEDLGARLEATQPKAVIIDLNHRSGRAVEAVLTLKANPAWRGTICGFVSHVQSELIEAARQGGCDLVLARSAFARDLPQLLKQLAGRIAKS
ncbi:MAG: hypothetical protein DMG21_22340 [Acidobacteria bacterium]|nr:MAG: hypothetical protein DMG21_22340 [Acidobacteriota bacterium]